MSQQAQIGLRGISQAVFHLQRKGQAGTRLTFRWVKLFLQYPGLLKRIREEHITCSGLVGKLIQGLALKTREQTLSQCITVGRRCDGCAGLSASAKCFRVFDD